MADRGEGRAGAVEPVIVAEAEREWEGWPEEDVPQRGGVLWRTLISAGVTPTAGLTLGVARLPPGEALHEHRHAQEEVYLVLEGEGVIRLAGRAHPVRAGSAVFIPGHALHGCENPGPGELRLAYVLAADSFDDVEYRFGEDAPAGG